MEDQRLRVKRELAYFRALQVHELSEINALNARLKTLKWRQWRKHFALTSVIELMRKDHKRTLASIRSREYLLEWMNGRYPSVQRKGEKR